MANAHINWQVNDRLKSWLAIEYHGETPRFTKNYENRNAVQQLVSDERGDKLDDWTVFNLGTSYKLTSQLTLTARLNNLLDKDFTHIENYQVGRNSMYAGDYFDTSRSTTGYVYPGRNLWISANYSF